MKLNSQQALLLIGLVGLCLANFSCSTTTKGEPIDREEVLNIQRGKTSKENVLATFGKPSQISLRGEREVLGYSYQYQRRCWNPLSIFPFVEASDVTTQYQRLQVELKNDVVTNFSYDEGEEEGDTKKFLEN